jgi:ABC-2 type transport system ATP-binding protein
MSAAIRLSGVTKRYGSRRGIETIDLSVSEGTILGFLGPNGAGKTTTIRILLGLLRADAGRAEVLGLDCWNDGRSARGHVGYLPGDLRLYPWFTVRSALSLMIGIHGRRFDDSSVEELLKAFELDANVPVRKMSRGTRQKLGLFLALLPDPRVIILDEPTTALDPLVRDQLHRILRDRAGAGATVFLSSHTLGEVEALCERIAIVRSGRIVADEALASLRSRATRQVTIRFRSAAAAADAKPPDELRINRIHDEVWDAELTGHATPLLDFLERVRPVDFTVGAPDLQGIFRSYYVTDSNSVGQ